MAKLKPRYMLRKTRIITRDDVPIILISRYALGMVLISDPEANALARRIVDLLNDSEHKDKPLQYGGSDGGEA